VVKGVIIPASMDSDLEASLARSLLTKSVA
jgi:hypothetical protein